MADTTRINVIDIQTGDSQKSITDLKKRIKELKSEILNLTEGTEEWKKAMVELGDAQHEYVAIAQDAKYMSQDFGEILANTAGVASTVTSVFGGVTASMQLMGIESEEAEKSIMKLMQIMTIAQTFTAIEDGVKRVKGLALAVKLATANVNKLKLALGSIGVGVAITAIGALVSHMQKLKEESEKVKEEFESTFDTKNFQFELLSKQFQSLQGNEEAQLKLLEQNKDICEELGIATNDLASANRILIDQKDEYLQMIKDKIKYEDIYNRLLINNKEQLREQEILKRYEDKLARGGMKKNEEQRTKILIQAGKARQKALLTQETELNNELYALNESSVKLQNERELELEKQKNKEKAELAYKAEKEKLAKLAELRQQALVWEQTEEDVVEETPKIETGNENFKYDNQTDEEFYDSVLTKANEVAQTEIEINAKKNDIIVDQEIATSNRIKAEKEKRIAIFKTTIDAMNMIMSASSQLLSAMQGSIDTETKKGFEENKKYEVAQATIAYLQGLVSAWSSAMQLPAFMIPIVGASLTGLLTATYGVNVSKIKSTKFGGTTSANTNVPSVNTSAVNSLQQPSFSNVRPTFSQSDVEELPMQKTYVLASDIETAINTRKTTVRNSTF